MISVHGLIQGAQKIDGLEIFPPAEPIRNPFALLARIVQIQHRGHRIHAQPVDVIFLEPEQRRGNQEAAHLVAAEIENGRIPFRMKALPRIRVLVQMRAVEIRQPMLIRGKVRRHPVEYHADALLMQVIDEVHQVLRRRRSGRSAQNSPWSDIPMIRRRDAR